MKIKITAHIMAEVVRYMEVDTYNEANTELKRQLIGSGLSNVSFVSTRVKPLSEDNKAEDLIESGTSPTLPEIVEEKSTFINEA